MGTALFYHLTRQPVEDTLRMLLTKALGADMRVVVRGTDEGQMDWLDEKLWLGPEDGFLPHGRAGGPHDDMQPVLLTTTPDVSTDARCLMSVHGADVTIDEVAAMDRVCVLFDGHDDAALNHARGQWKTLKDAGAQAQYWSEESGRWEKKAET